eukprot:1012776_1
MVSATPKKKVVTNWVKNNTNETNNIKVSQIKPKPKEIITKTAPPKKKVINSWVKGANDPDGNIKPGAIKQRPKVGIKSGAKPLAKPQPISPVSPVSPSSSLSNQTTDKKKVSFKIHDKSPNIGDKEKKKKKVVFNDDDTNDNGDGSGGKKKKKKKGRYLSFFGRKKNKKPKVETNLSEEYKQTENEPNPMEFTRSLSISQSSTENLMDNKTGATADKVNRPQMRNTQSEKPRPTSAKFAGRSGSVFGRLKSANITNNNDGDVKKELEQLKKIRKQKLKQLNGLKKDFKNVNDKYNKIQKEKKNMNNEKK